MGKLIVAFSMFLAASALAIHEAKPPAPPPETARPEPTAAIDHTPPSRAIHDDVPPWVKYAAPAPTPPPHTVVIETPPPRVITIDTSEITIERGDVLDVVDRCPDDYNGSDDNDGCPEPTARDIDQRTVTMIY